MLFSVNQLQQALSNHAFVPFYQPIINNINKEIVGCEILARWNHPEKGLLNAGYFIESIESNELTGNLTRSLMSDVLSTANDIHHAEAAKFFLTININLSLVMSPVFRHYMLTLNNQLILAGLTPVFEITEREDIRDFPGAAEVFSELVDQGLTFAVDDFGTGYASEALLDVTHSAFIKIDRAFTADPHNSVISKVLTLAHESGACVIAEGVESAEQADWLQMRGVDYLQGYHCGMPVSAERFCRQLDS